MTHVTSSPHYPQSNGKAEATVKSMKTLISAAWTSCSVNWDQLSCALFQYRNTPCRKDGLSPTQKIFGHPVQDTLPAYRRSFAPKWQRSSQEADSATTHTSKTSQATYDQHAHPLSDLQVGNHVAVQNPTSKLWDIYGTITAVGPYRHYFIKTQSGRILVRNRSLSIAVSSILHLHLSSYASSPSFDVSSAPLLTHQSLVRRRKRINSEL